MKFAALRHPDCRFYLVGTMLSMMADNIEHVISYWVLYQKFHSPALAGFAVVSHWLPSLVFSVYFGGLADRYDCRKVIQVAQVMYMGVSAAWGYLFRTGTAPVLLGEFGTKLETASDRAWFDKMAAYLGGDLNGDGASDLAPLTTLMESARRLGEDAERLAEAQAEVEAVLANPPG